MSDEHLQNLKRQPKTPDNIARLARTMCRNGQHSFDHMYGDSQYLGHDWNSGKLAQHLGLVELQGSGEYKHWPADITTWCGQKECFFCGKIIRILNITNTRTKESTPYEFEI